MKKSVFKAIQCACVMTSALAAVPANLAAEPIKISVDWTRTSSVSRTEPTLQVIPNAQARRGRPLHDVTYSSIKSLDAKYVRYLPWGPYPRLQIAALYPPTAQGASWDFSYIDPELTDFFEATRGREPIVNFSSIPAWMLKRATPISYSKDPDKMDWGCDRIAAGESRLELADPTGKQLADYYARIVSWYTQGGFTDENGKYHRSGYKYELPWWGVLNEHDRLGAKQYTIAYDAIVTAVRKVSPTTRFVGLEAVGTAIPGGSDPEFFEYFLNPKNHAPGIPLDMIAYHFYAYTGNATDLEHWQYTFFEQADAFLAQVRFIEAIRKRLSPSTLAYPDELGSMIAENPCKAGLSPPAIQPLYWNLSASLYAYLYLELTKLGIDAAGQAGFSFYPGNFPSVSMVNWETAQPNARFHVLKLLADHFGPGDKLIASTQVFLPTQDVASQAFDTPTGKKVLLVNKRARELEIELELTGRVQSMEVVDGLSGENAARKEKPLGNRLRLKPFAVAVVTVDSSARTEKSESKK